MPCSNVFFILILFCAVAFEVTSQSFKKTNYDNNVEISNSLNIINWTNERGVYIAKLYINNEVITSKILIE